MTRFDSYSEHPATSIRFDESPLSEYRRCQSRIAMRRHFDSRVTTLAKFPPTKSNRNFRTFESAADFARWRKPLIRRHLLDTVSNGTCHSIKKMSATNIAKPRG